MKPEVVPVNYKVDHESLVFRTGEGTKLRAAGGPLAVALEADGHDAAKAWSVLVKGRATEISDAEELQRAQALPLRFWVLGEKGHWIRITPEEVTGRQIHRQA